MQSVIFTKGRSNENNKHREEGAIETVSNPKDVLICKSENHPSFLDYHSKVRLSTRTLFCLMRPNPLGFRAEKKLPFRVSYLCSAGSSGPAFVSSQSGCCNTPILVVDRSKAWGLRLIKTVCATKSRNIIGASATVPSRYYYGAL